MKPLRSIARVALVSAGVTVASLAHGLPSVGANRPATKITDAWSRTLDLAKLSGRPVLLLYEDKDSAPQNQPLKDELAKLAKGDKYKATIALVAVADVSAYDYWPARGFVKDAIKKESRKHATTIYCDWDGRFRESLALDANTSNVVLYGKDGSVLLSHAGAMPPEKRARLVELLRAEVGER